jgi:hypothetical protein
MPPAAFSVTSPLSGCKSGRRVAVLLTGAATIAGGLIAFAAPAAATVQVTAATATTMQACGGGTMGSGNRTCVESTTTPGRATGTIPQDCGGAGQFGSGNRACGRSAPTSGRAIGVTAQACGNGSFGSGNRTCVE